MRGVAVVVGLTLALLGLLYGVAVASTDRSAFARAVAWQGADVDDWRRFPARAVAARGEPLSLRFAPDGGAALLARLTAPAATGEVPLDRFLADTQTTAFVVLRDDEVLIERYYGSADRLSVSTSFSVAKSFLSSLVGVAIASGRISSVDDPVTKYVPELLQRDERFAQVTLRHLLSMSSGLRYDEVGLPWSDDSLTYYDPDLRRLALHATTVERQPAQAFHYNNYNPLLLGLVLERAVGKPVATQLQDGLWGPAGMEFDASWSLDSAASGFEKLESGVNARALDFARFGLLYLNEGRRGERTVLPADWVRDSTSPQSGAGAPARGYGYFWWLQGDAQTPRYMARGNKGQFIYVAPDQRLVIVRLGREFGYGRWPSLLDELATRIGTLAAP